MLIGFICRSYTNKNSKLNNLKHIFQSLNTPQTHSRSAPCSHFSSEWTEMASSENLPGSCSSHSFTFRWANLMSLISLWSKLQNMPAGIVTVTTKLIFPSLWCSRGICSSMASPHRSVHSVMNDKSKRINKQANFIGFHLNSRDLTRRKFKAF